MISDGQAAQFKAIAIFMVAIVLCFFLFPSGYGADRFVLMPRSEEHWPGIIGMTFLHSGLGHLLSNMIALVPMSILLTFTHPRPMQVLLILTVLAGGILWFFGKPGSGHIGASGLVFALAGYLVARGVSQPKGLVLVAGALVAYFFGADALAGINPAIEASGISWEGHLSGLVGGAIYGVMDTRKT